METNETNATGAKTPSRAWAIARRSVHLKFAVASAIALAAPFIWAGAAHAQGCSCG